jgi:hypothetical protein
LASREDVVTVSVTYDYASPDATDVEAGPDLSWTHVVGSDATAILVAVDFYYTSTLSQSDVGAQIGTTTMEVLRF